MGDGGVILFYWVLNLGYCTKFKQYAIIDVHRGIRFCAPITGRRCSHGSRIEQVDRADDLPHHPLHEFCQTT